MISQTKLGIVFLSSIVMAGACLAQNTGDALKYYHLDFVLKELESGKVINTRSYSTTVSTSESGGFNIRTGNKIPASTGATGSASTYIDVGVNIDCRPGSVKAVQDQLALYITADITSAATDPPSASLPLIRQTKWSSNVIVPLRKPTTIFSSDDPTTKRQTQLELTAIPIR